MVNLMQLKSDSSKQKLLGAYYTPPELANLIVGLLSESSYDKVLEPSFGGGIFLKELINNNITIGELDAVEIESEPVKKAKKEYDEYKNYKLIQEDFFDYYKDSSREKYDLIIGNPPYIRYQYLTESQRLEMSDILTSHGMKPNKLINAWVAFTVACVQMLSDNGKIAFVIPAEILQVAYAKDLRRFLANTLDNITLLTFEELLFDNVQQEIVVLIGEKKSVYKGIRIIESKNINEFNFEEYRHNDYQEVYDVKEKWIRYFITNKESKLITKIQKDKRFKPFSSYGIINVGITTGHNDYFSVTDKVSKKYELDDVTRPLIGRSSHAHGIYFTYDDWKKNLHEKKKSRLVCFPSNVEYSDYPFLHKQYIEWGEEKEVHTGYKCSIRDRWYIVPSVWVPDAFFLRRNNLYPKFVLNDCDAVSTDTMHRIKLHDGIDKNKLLLSYYNSISFAFTEFCGRSYGGGVLEILPNEMGRIMLPDIMDIDIDISIVSSILKRVDNIVRNNVPIENALDLVDEEILIKRMGFTKDICLEFRQIWKKMQRRRLVRK